jgi:hypothetical protein
VVAALIGGFLLFVIAKVIPTPSAPSCLVLFVLSYAVYCLVLMIFPAKRRILIHTLDTVCGRL